MARFLVTCWQSNTEKRVMDTLEFEWSHLPLLPWWSMVDYINVSGSWVIAQFLGKVLEQTFSNIFCPNTSKSFSLIHWDLEPLQLPIGTNSGDYRTTKVVCFDWFLASLSSLALIIITSGREWASGCLMQSHHPFSALPKIPQLQFSSFPLKRKGQGSTNCSSCWPTRSTGPLFPVLSELQSHGLGTVPCLST